MDGRSPSFKYDEGYEFRIAQEKRRKNTLFWSEEAIESLALFLNNFVIESIPSAWEEYRIWGFYWNFEHDESRLLMDAIIKTFDTERDEFERASIGEEEQLIRREFVLSFDEDLSKDFRVRNSQESYYSAEEIIDPKTMKRLSKKYEEWVKLRAKGKV